MADTHSERGGKAGFDRTTGEVHGSGAGAGGEGNPDEDYDADPQGGADADPSGAARPVDESERQPHDRLMGDRP